LYVLAFAFSMQASAQSIALNEAEEAYLADNAPIVFVSQSNYPPFEFSDANGKSNGMMIELARWIAAEAGFQAHFAHTDFNSAQSRLQSGQADVLTSFFYSQDRDKTFDFTQTVFEVPAAIFVPIDRPDITRLEDLKGLRVATQLGDYAEDYLAKAGIDVTLVSTANFADAILAVLGGKADAMIGDEQIVLFHLYRSGLNVEMKRVSESLYTGLNSMAVKEDNLLLKSILDKGITQAREHGTLKRINEKWLGEVLPSASIQWRNYWPHAMLVVVIGLWIVAWNMRLRQLVRRKTRELQHNQNRLTEILNVTGTATWELDVTTGKLRINDCWAAMLGYAPEQLTSTSLPQWKQWVHPDDVVSVNQALDEHLHARRPYYSCEFRLRHRDGHWIWVLDRGQVTRRDANGHALTASGTRIDISAEKHAEADLRLAASVFHNAHDAIMLTDDQGITLEVNAAFTQITGYTPDEVLNQRAPLLEHRFGTHSDDRLLAAASDDIWQGEVWETRKNGERYLIQLTLSRVKDEATRTAHYVIVFTDISRQKDYEARLQHLAYFDQLTNLPNRESFTQHLTRVMHDARESHCQLVLAYLDLDGFKDINDRYDHALGDRVLKVVAKRLSSTLQHDDIVARLGGDEFIMVLPHQQCDQEMKGMIQRLIQRVNQPIRFTGHEVQVSASVGVAAYDGSEDIEPDQFIRQADHAMYQAKQLGKNRYHMFDLAHERAVRGHHQSIARIQKALVDDEFVLFYQPKINMRSGDVIGVEALIRWQHPEQGLLSPDRFLPVIQQHPFAITLGEWVIRTALTQCSTWKQQGINLPISVNVDGIHLQAANFTGWLRHTLEAFPDIVSGDLEIEALESSALDDIQRVAAIMRECQTFGVQFALDDFGTGYSTLAYLRYLPAGILKIDRSFVYNMLDNEEDLVMLKGVLSLAGAFQRRVIAEGVETYAHSHALLALGCDYGQGYAFARPMPADKLLEWKKHFTLTDGTPPQHSP